MVSAGLVQINNSFSGQNYLPLSVGILQTSMRADNYEWLLPIYKRIPVREAVAQLRGADVVYFSVYVWNFQLSLEIARRISCKGSCKVVFGGPHVTKDLREKYPFVDEIYMGTIDMDTPSPYLEGTFDPLIEANPAENWIALWETNRGCPFSCTFCDWGSATKSKVRKFDMERLEKEMDWFARHKVEYIYCCDANFGMLPRDLDIVRYAVESKRKSGYPHKLSVQNTKNSTERSYAVHKMLSDAGMNQGVTLSMQSLDKDTLKAISRANISLESFETIQHRFEEDGVETYTDLILGLPGETYESFLDGTCKTIENGQHNRIQFNNLSILPNAEMADPEYQRKYGMVTVEANIINAHGRLDEDEVQETQLLVVGTRSMPKKDWVRTRAMTWMISLLYFDKLLQIPLTLLHDTYQADYWKLFSIFTEPQRDIPTILKIWHFFLDKAKEIQDGGEEFCYSEDWLGIWWPADEYAFIMLTVTNRIDKFYKESERLLRRISWGKDVAKAVYLNKELLSQPEGDLDTWLRETVWYGNKKGAYLNVAK